MKRNTQLDAARGLGMLLVVFGHCCYSLEYPINKFILSFHMPLFFFLSGLTAPSEYRGGGIQKKAKTLFIPQILLGAIAFVYDTAFSVLKQGGSVGDVNLFYCFWRWWFLPVLFLVSVLFYGIQYIEYKSKRSFISKNLFAAALIVMCLLLYVIVKYIVPFPDETPFYLNVVPISFVFYYMGFRMKKICLNGSNQKNIFTETFNTNIMKVTVSLTGVRRRRVNTSAGWSAILRMTSGQTYRV